MLGSSLLLFYLAFGPELVVLLISDRFVVTRELVVTLAAARPVETTAQSIQPIFASHHCMSSMLRFRLAGAVATVASWAFVIPRYGLSDAAWGVLLAFGLYLGSLLLLPKGCLWLIRVPDGAFEPGRRDSPIERRANDWRQYLGRGFSVGFRNHMERPAIGATRLIGRHWGEVFPFYYVMEFPKSGGSWLADLIGDYLRLPRARRPIFPIGFEAVIHGHWRYSPKYRRVFYLYRDGRDIAVSSYFRVIREYQTPRLPSDPAYFRRRYPSLFASDLDLHDVRGALPAFIADWARTPVGVRENWADHVSSWIDGPNVTALSYEDLIADTLGTLSRALPRHTGEEVDATRMAATAFKFSFEQLTGRKPGEEARGDHIRKGVAGDWRNHFTRAAGEVFDREVGEMLLRLGYVTDRSWYQDLPET